MAATMGRLVISVLANRLLGEGLTCACDLFCLTSGTIVFVPAKAVLSVDLDDCPEPELFFEGTVFFFGAAGSGFNESLLSGFTIGERDAFCLSLSISFSRFSTKGSLPKSELATLCRKMEPLPQLDESLVFMLL